MDETQQTYERQIADAASRLWHFATEVYAVPAVAASCLQAQDDWGVDVNLLLYVSWCAKETHRLNGAAISAAQARCQPWQQRVVQPLRAQRRAWRKDPRCAAEYTALKALELNAEKTQLGFLAQVFVNETALSGQRQGEHPDRDYRMLLAEHLQILACHYGLDEAAFRTLEESLAAA